MMQSAFELPRRCWNLLLSLYCQFLLLTVATTSTAAIQMHVILSLQLEGNARKLACALWPSLAQEQSRMCQGQWPPARAQRGAAEDAGGRATGGGGAGGGRGASWLVESHGAQRRAVSRAGSEGRSSQLIFFFPDCSLRGELLRPQQGGKGQEF